MKRSFGVQILFSLSVWTDQMRYNDEGDISGTTTVTITTANGSLKPEEVGFSEIITHNSLRLAKSDFLEAYINLKNLMKARLFLSEAYIKLILNYEYEQFDYNKYYKKYVIDGMADISMKCENIKDPTPEK